MQENNSVVVKDLCHLVADTYTVYTKTQFFHWNVSGELFFMYHEFFEKQFKQLEAAIDVLAERIRALNAYAPGTFQQFQQMAGIKLEPNIPSAQGMIKELLHDHEHIDRELGVMIKRAEENDDQVTMGLMIERQTHHQTLAWVLRSSLNSEFHPQKS